MAKPISKPVVSVSLEGKTIPAYRREHRNIRRAEVTMTEWLSRHNQKD